MDIEKLLTVLNTLTPIIPTLISALISYLIASIKAKSEIKKVVLSLKYEDKQALYASFNDLMVAIDEYYFSNCQLNKSQLIAAISRFLSAAPKDFFPLLVRLNKAIETYNKTELAILRDEIFELYSHSQHNSDYNTGNKY